MTQLAINGGQPTIDYEFQRYNPIGKEEKEAAVRVIESGILSDFLASWGPKFYGGKYVQTLEKNWAEKFNVKYAISFNSATSALTAAIGALNIGPGDEVIVSPYTMTASATAIIHFNAIPVFADIDEKTFNITAQSIEEQITPYTKAVMIPNIMGQPANYDEILKLTQKHQLTIVEDTAQAPIAKYKNQYAGTIGNIGVYSLNRHKHIHTGEGGIAVTKDSDLAEKLMMIRNHAEAVVGLKGSDSLVNLVGYNLRLGEIEAAMGIEQLKKIDDLVQARINMVNKIEKQLMDLKGYIELPTIEKNATHVYYLMAIKYVPKYDRPHRDRIVDALCKEGVPIRKGFQKPLYLFPMYQKRIAYGKQGCPFTCPLYKGNVDYSKGICPNVERVENDLLMPFHVGKVDLNDSDIEKIGIAFHKVFSNLDQL